MLRTQLANYIFSLVFTFPFNKLKISKFENKHSFGTAIRSLVIDNNHPTHTNTVTLTQLNRTFSAIHEPLHKNQ